MRVFLSFILVFIILSCEETVVVGLPPAQNLVTVQSWITDLEERQEVRISRSNGFADRNEVQIIEDASVVVQSRTGQTFLFSHNQDGLYTSNDEFAGEPGTEYRLRIQLNDGEEIRSAWERMPQQVAINSISVNSFEENDPENPNEQFTVFFPKVDAIDPENQNNFYRWVFFRNNLRYVEPESITIQNDRFFDGNLIPNNFQSFGYEPQDTIIVNLQSINREAYDFLALLRSQITSLGTTVGTTPAIIEGNLAFLSEDQSEEVLGYFGTIAVSADTVIVE